MFHVHSKDYFGRYSLVLNVTASNTFKRLLWKIFFGLKCYSFKHIKMFKLQIHPKDYFGRYSSVLNVTALFLVAASPGRKKGFGFSCRLSSIIYK